MTRRIGILGGTFDPIHCGHLDVGAAAQSALGLTQVFVIPSNVPPHRPQPHASSFHRFAMVSRAVAGRSGWMASDLELSRDAHAPSYTTTTLQGFHDRYAPGELFFIIGADAFADIATWKDYPRILERAHFAVVSRPGFSVNDLPDRLPAIASRMSRPPIDANAPHGTVVFLIDARTADVSSTAIRRRCAEGQSIAGLVDAGVQQHIEQNGLYTSNAPDGRGSNSPQDPAAGRLHG